MAGKRPPMRKPVVPDSVADATNVQKNHSNTEGVKMSEDTNFWVNYVDMWDKVGVGKTGVAIVHGGVAAGGTYALGKYANIDIINANVLPAVGIAGAVGVASTLLMNAVMIGENEKVTLEMRRVMRMTPAEQSKLLYKAAEVLNAQQTRVSG